MPGYISESHEEGGQQAFERVQSGEGRRKMAEDRFCSTGGSESGGGVEEAELIQEWSYQGQKWGSEEEESGGGNIVRNRRII